MPQITPAALSVAPKPLSLAQGRLAALSWGRADAPTWLALHGWLDNAASFTRLAPLLVEALDIRIVALDFRGHGHSAHAPQGGDYALCDYAPWGWSKPAYWPIPWGRQWPACSPLRYPNASSG